MHARVPKGPQLSASPAVVLVHGIGVSSRYMAPLAARLATRFRVSAVDLPGFGLSDAPPRPLDLDGFAHALSAWIQAEGLGRAALVANSFGCQIALRTALRHPEAVTRLVLQGPTGDPDLSTRRLLARWLFQGMREPTSLNALIARDYLDCGLRQVLSAFHASKHDPILATLADVTASTLIVRGTRDLIASQKWCVEMAARMPRARLAVVPHGTHAMNYASPDALVGAAAGFLQADEEQDPRRHDDGSSSLRS
jgi:2-hydroxy-6-oxonona-2,4-dienedioate hydrolase